MQYEEEELEQTEDEQETTKEVDDPEVISEEEESMNKIRPLRRQPATGVLLTLFAGVVIILLGGLASYYYYTFQAQGAVGEKQVKDTWQEAAESTEDLVTGYGRVSAFADVTDRSEASFSVMIDRANRSVRDSSFELQNVAGLNIQASTVASKMVIFLDDYSEYLAEMRKVVDRADDVVALKDSLSVLKETANKSEESYDALLLVNKGFLKADLPRSVFDIGEKLADLAQKFIDEGGELEEKNQKIKEAGQTVVSKFVQGWQNKDGEAMGSYLTTGAKAEFPVAILEDSVDVTGLTITETQVPEDGSKITIKGQLKKKTPDDVTNTETWQFVLLPSGDKWLIDSWKKI